MHVLHLFAVTEKAVVEFISCDSLFVYCFSRCEKILCFLCFCAVLAEFSVSTAENSKRLADFLYFAALDFMSL